MQKYYILQNVYLLITQFNRIKVCHFSIFCLFTAGSQGSNLAFESRQRYSSGYIQCMHEVHNLLLSCPSMDKSLGAGLLNHLLKALPQISGESGGTGNAGSVLSTSPTQSPISLSSFRPSLHLHTPSSPVSPSSPSSPHCSPRVLMAREGAGVQRSPPRSPSPQPLASAALPPNFPGGDLSMWRPW